MSPRETPFNSIVQLEHEHGIPRNPFINAGAIVVSDVLLAGHQPREAIGEILRFIQFLADDDTIFIDRGVAASERETGFRNFALANYMRAFENLDHPAELTLGVYFHHCAIAMSCRQLALAGRFLAYGGRNPATGHSVVSAERARRINALMLTCGHYDGSGDFAFRVGIPGKSGVGGGILGSDTRRRLARRLVARPQRQRQFASRLRRDGKTRQDHELVRLLALSRSTRQEGTRNGLAGSSRNTITSCG